MNLTLNKKYLCKKSLFGKICFNIQKGKLYRIRKIGETHVMIRGNGSYEAFSIKTNCNVSPYYFWEYFYSIKEERKEKLNKIYNDYKK